MRYQINTLSRLLCYISSNSKSILRLRKTGPGKREEELTWRSAKARNRAVREAKGRRLGGYFPYRATARWMAQSEAASTSIALP